MWRLGNHKGYGFKFVMLHVPEEMNIITKELPFVLLLQLLRKKKGETTRNPWSSGKNISKRCNSTDKKKMLNTPKAPGPYPPKEKEATTTFATIEIVQPMQKRKQH